MGPNSAMWGREAEFQCGDEEKGEFCEFFSRSAENVHQNEVGGGRGHDIYIVFNYYLRRAKRAGAENGICPRKKKKKSFLC